MCQPRWMVYQTFERLADLEEIVQMTSIASIGGTIDPSAPSIWFKIKISVKQYIQFSNMALVDCGLQVDITTKVKELLF